MATHSGWAHDTLEQAWATSGPRDTYGPQITLMWPANYIWSFINSYFDFENTLTSKNICFTIKTNLKISLPAVIHYMSLILPAKPKELATPDLLKTILFFYQLKSPPWDKNDVTSSKINNYLSMLLSKYNE